jgi:hypothetical protein
MEQFRSLYGKRENAMVSFSSIPKPLGAQQQTTGAQNQNSGSSSGGGFMGGGQQQQPQQEEKKQEPEIPSPPLAIPAAGLLKVMFLSKHMTRSTPEQPTQK